MQSSFTLPRNKPSKARRDWIRSGRAKPVQYIVYIRFSVETNISCNMNPCYQGLQGRAQRIILTLPKTGLSCLYEQFTFLGVFLSEARRLKVQFSRMRITYLAEFLLIDRSQKYSTAFIVELLTYFFTSQNWALISKLIFRIFKEHFYSF